MSIFDLPKDNRWGEFRARYLSTVPYIKPSRAVIDFIRLPYDALMVAGLTIATPIMLFYEAAKNAGMLLLRGFYALFDMGRGNGFPTEWPTFLSIPGFPETLTAAKGAVDYTVNVFAWVGRLFLNPVRAVAQVMGPSLSPQQKQSLNDLTDRDKLTADTYHEIAISDVPFEVALVKAFDVGSQTPSYKNYARFSAGYDEIPYRVFGGYAPKGFIESYATVQDRQTKGTGSHHCFAVLTCMRQLQILSGKPSRFYADGKADTLMAQVSDLVNQLHNTFGEENTSNYMQTAPMLRVMHTYKHAKDSEGLKEVTKLMREAGVEHVPKEAVSSNKVASKRTSASTRRKPSTKRQSANKQTTPATQSSHASNDKGKPPRATSLTEIAAKGRKTKQPAKNNTQPSRPSSLSGRSK